VLVLVLLPPVASAFGLGDAAAGGESGLLLTLGLTLGRVAAFAVLMIVVGRRLFPWFLWRWRARARASCSRCA
jgi:CPA2 family monovalent cation:H+ antiporter-2